MRVSRHNNALGDVLSYGISKAVPGALSLASVILFVRWMGQAEYGRYAIAIATINMWAALFSAWMRQSVLRFYTLWSRDTRVLRDVVRIGLIASLVTGGFLMLALGMVGEPRITLSTSAVSVLLFGLLTAYQIRLALFQAQMRPGCVVRVELLRSIAGLILPLAAMATFTANHWEVLIGLSVAYAGSFLIAGPWSGVTDAIRNPHTTNSNGGQERPLGWDRRQVLLRCWSYGWPISAWLGCLTLLQLTDRYLIEYFYDVAETGVYASIYDFVVRSYSLLLFPLLLAAHPRIMREWNEGRPERARQIIRRTIAAQCVIFVPVFTAYAFTERVIVNEILGVPQASAAVLVRPLAIGGFLWQVALLIHKPLELANRTILMLGTVVVAVTVNIALNWYGLPRWGTVTAAYSTMVAALIYVVLCFILGRWQPKGPESPRCLGDTVNDIRRTDGPPD